MSEYSTYFSSINGFMRSMVLSVGEMAKEIYQAKRQEIKNYTPRVKRHGSYIFLRAGTNVLLRDIQTRIVLDKMLVGANSVYVDYLDYDEIAHHAGIARPESLAALTGLDQVVGLLIKAKKYAARPYHIVFVSDHGQSQGQTFKQLHDGKKLEDIVSDLLGVSRVLSSTEPIESKSTAQSILKEGASSSSASGKVFQTAQEKYDEYNSDKNINEEIDVVVTGSGNLGNIWITKYDERPTYEQIEADFPGFVEKLLNTKGIGVALIRAEKDEHLCVSKNGVINLKTKVVQGINPLLQYEFNNTDALLKLTKMKQAPDVQVISDFNRNSGEVHAFEELVGNHGGIGGWQTDAILLHPSDLKIPKSAYSEGKIVDSVNVHKIFKHWLKLEQD